MRAHNAGDVALAGTAWVMLGVSESVLRVVPFRRLMGALGLAVEADGRDRAAPVPVVDGDDLVLGRLHWAIGAAARCTPWTSKCLSQALVGAMLLRLRGETAQVWFGVRPASAADARPMTAHAWLVSDGRVVTGAAGREAYGVVAVYATRGR